MDSNIITLGFFSGYFLIKASKWFKSLCLKISFSAFDFFIPEIIDA